MAKKAKPKTLPGKVGAKPAPDDARHSLESMVKALDNVVNHISFEVGAKPKISDRELVLSTAVTLRAFLRLVLDAKDEGKI